MECQRFKQSSIGNFNFLFLLNKSKFGKNLTLIKTLVILSSFKQYITANCKGWATQRIPLK